MTQAGRKEKRRKAVILTLNRYCQQLRDSGTQRISQQILTATPRLMQHLMPDAQPSTLVKHVGVVFQMGRKISAHTELVVSMDEVMKKDKDLVPYDILLEKINIYREQGNPKYRKMKDEQGAKSLYISQIFGLFMTFLVVTVQRNRTVREIKFEDFSIVNGRAVLFMYASKTRDKINVSIDNRLKKAVDCIREERSWMVAKIATIENEIGQGLTNEEAQRARRKIVRLKRRLRFVFSFCSEGAVHKRFTDFKQWLITEKVPYSKEMIVHDVRRIALQHINEVQGPEAARK